MKTALIIVDVQNYFINEYTKELPLKIADYIDKNKFDYLLFTKFVNNKNSNFFKILNWKKCLGSPETDIVSVLQKFIKKNNVFDKSSYSIFKSKKLADFLKKNRITKLFICGIDTDACILASAFEGFDLGYQITILHDLCHSHYGKDLHDSAFKIIEKNLKEKVI